MPSSGEPQAVRFGALLVAGGRGVRFGDDTPKQFVALGGEPLFLHAARVLHAAAAVAGWWIVAPEEHRDLARAAIEAAGLQGRLRGVVPGGPTRQDSVWRGLRALAAEAPDLTHVLVHDAVRPFLTVRLVQAVVAVAARWGAATAALPQSDTLVRAAAGPGDPAWLDVVVDRHRTWSVQTPQAFAVPLLLRAHERARAQERTATDDAGLVRALGEPVGLVPGNWWNIKVTERHDLQRAALLLEVRSLLEAAEAERGEEEA